MSTPKVNFFIHYVPYLSRKQLKTINLKEYIKKRNFYGCGSNYNYLDYVQRGAVQHISPDADPLNGVFNGNGLLNKQEIKNLKAQFNLTKSPIWHGLISFEQSFGKEKCNSFEQAKRLIQNQFPKFLKRAGFDPENICWFAGLHQNTNFRHIHFAFYEKNKTRFRAEDSKKHYSRGAISKRAIEKAKIDIELNLMDLSFIYETRKEITKNNNEYLRKKELLGGIMKTINNLNSMLPNNGRLSYNSENMQELRPYINYISELLIKSNPILNDKFNKFLDFINEKDMIIIDLCNKQKIKPDNLLLKRKYLDDLYRRLGNQIINIAKYIRMKEERIKNNSKYYLVQKRIRKQKKSILFRECEYLNRITETEAFKSFEDYYNRLNEIEFKKIIEEKSNEIF